MFWKAKKLVVVLVTFMLMTRKTKEKLERYLAFSILSLSKTRLKFY